MIRFPFFNPSPLYNLRFFFFTRKMFDWAVKSVWIMSINHLFFIDDPIILWPRSDYPSHRGLRNINAGTFIYKTAITTIFNFIELWSIFLLIPKAETDSPWIRCIPNRKGRILKNLIYTTQWDWNWVTGSLLPSVKMWNWPAYRSGPATQFDLVGVSALARWLIAKTLNTIKIIEIYSDSFGVA